ncbi:MAG: hypothetical protein IT356_10070 [Gemmatimonadaceae bacterium]|nr:hypothetical protein [Gemmatimonadaceae bacterium]
MIKSVIALLGGFAIMTFSLLIATVIAGVVLGLQPGVLSTQFLATVLTCGVLAAGFGGYSTAALAPNRHFAHVLILAAMVLLMAVSSLLKPQPGQPLWYLATALALQPLSVIAGGGTRVLRKARARTQQ